jgi:hypothetical protein
MLKKSQITYTTKQVHIEAINASRDLMMRVELNQATVSEYVEAMKGGSEFPPLECAELDGELLLYDGFLRYAAYKRRHTTDIAIRTRIADTMDEVVLWAVKANAYPGLKRTNEDKKKSVEVLLETAISHDMTNEQIANAAGVSDETVRKYRAQRSSNQTLVSESPKPRTNKRGQQRPPTYNKKKKDTPSAPKGTGRRVYMPPIEKIQWPKGEKTVGGTGYVQALPHDQKRKQDQEIAAREIIGRIREIGQLCKTLLETIPAKINAADFVATIDSMASSALWKSKLDQHRADLDTALPIIRNLLDRTRKPCK